jgi:hypothetical protein
VIDEDLAHQGGRYAEEVGPTRESHAIDIDQSKVDLVNERDGLERVPRRLASETAARHPAQFVVDERDQVVERRGVSLAPGGAGPLHHARGALDQRLVRESGAGLRFISYRGRFRFLSNGVAPWLSMDASCNIAANISSFTCRSSCR